MKLIKWIHEGDKIPFGFFIKSGVTYLDHQWRTVQTVERGLDGNIEAVFQTERPTGNPIYCWMTFGLNLHYLRITARFKANSQKIIWNVDTPYHYAKKFNK